jgi:hypothetical protein
MQTNRRIHRMEMQKPTFGAVAMLCAVIMLSPALPARSEPPVITRQPGNLMRYLGASTNFSVIATGAPPLSFQWRLRGIDLPGNTLSSLSIMNAQFSNAGPYSVVVSDADGAVTSATAWLSVLPTNVVNLGGIELSFGAISTDHIWEAPHMDDQNQALTGDGLTLVYASRATNGYGGLDLWMVTRPTLTSPWSTPDNLGATVNSAADEDTPRLSPDGLSLYFRSNRSGPGARGGFDIWVATRPTPVAPFGLPVNLGPAINSSADEYFPQISADNRTLIFSSSRTGDPGTVEVWMSTRTNALAAWEPAVHLPAPINHAGDTFANELSRDGLLLFLKSWRPITDPPGAPGSAAIYVCWRPNQDQPFGAPVLIRPILPTIASGGADVCSLSDDGTTLSVGTFRAVYPAWPQFHQISITPIPQLIAPTKDGLVEFEFGLLGREGANYEIQVSPDLNTWQSWITTNTAGTTRLSDPVSAPEGRRFYRVLSH